MEPKFKKDDFVRKNFYKDQVGVIMKEPTLNREIYWYKVRFYSGISETIDEDSLELLVEDLDPEKVFLDFSFADNKSFSRILTFNKLIGGYTNNPTSFRASKTLFKPHQYKPLLKFLSSDNQRILIADEVGLGKTIEAGYVLLEVEARERISSSFIICPKSLCIKWEREMQEKFGLEYELKNKQQILKYLDDVQKGNQPKKFLAVCSYQMIRGKAVREKLNEVNPEIDIVIFDEMHWARNNSSQISKLARQISQYADAVLGLTATPIMLGNENLYTLLNILNPSEFQSENDFNSRIEENSNITAAIRSLSVSDYKQTLLHLQNFALGSYSRNLIKDPLYLSIIETLKTSEVNREVTIKLLKDVTELSLLSHIVTRTRRKDVELKSIRKSQIIKLKFTDEEKHFYDAVTNHIKDKYANSTQRSNSAFALMMPQRQVASCIPAMIEAYFDSPSFINSFLHNEDLSTEFNIDEDLEVDDLVDDYENIFGNVKSKFLKVDSKYNEFRTAIKEIFSHDKEVKILVFSFFKATLNYLKKRLAEDGVDSYVISGDFDADQRQELLDRFRNTNEIKVMLSSEVGSEGLDLEFCSVVVNYDLPWNPMVVEQRIGRIDRFGQKADVVTIINFAIEDTIEEKILRKLYERINIFREAIGDLENILGEEVNRLTKDLLTLNLTPEEQEKRINDTADIICNMKIQAEQLEVESAGLVTNDEYFKQELDSIIKEKRYLTPEELLVYINEFMKTKFPDSQLNETSVENVYSLYVPRELESGIHQAMLQYDTYSYFEFIRHLNREERKILVTFDAEIALGNKKISLLTGFHPLLVFITRYYKANPKEIYPGSAITIEESNYLNEGLFFYATYEHSIQGARNYKTISHVILNKELELAGSVSEASEIMGNIVTSGKPFEHDSLKGSFDMECILSKMEEINLKRFEDVFEEISRLTESTIQKQLDITNRLYKGRINKIEGDIENVKYDKEKSKIIPVWKSKLIKLNDDLRNKIEAIQNKKRIEKSTRLLSAGIINVTRSSDGSY